ncbi:hypothetical protein [Escherichia phage pEC-M719-6WT.2]|nr:hypothetical protein [Escherichia phage pEC-M719-6WT.2]
MLLIFIFHSTGCTIRSDFSYYRTHRPLWKNSVKRVRRFSCDSKEPEHSKTVGGTILQGTSVRRLTGSDPVSHSIVIANLTLTTL